MSGIVYRPADQFNMRPNILTKTQIHIEQPAIEMCEFIERFFEQPSEMLGVDVVHR